MFSKGLCPPLVVMGIVAADLAVSVVCAQTARTRVRDSGSGVTQIQLSRMNARPGSDVNGAAAPSATGRRELPQQNNHEYRIGPGDVLGVEVWKEPDASSPSAPVRPDGKISVAMLGEVPAAGLTPAELENVLAAKYREFIRGARVTLTVKEINSQKVYLIGEVKKEGPVRLQAPITVLQALAEAGGVTDYAKRRKIYILRSAQDRQFILPFDYDAVVRGEKMEQNIVLAAGDTIIVPR
jgi:polysaccharide export outer membrane protein